MTKVDRLKVRLGKDAGMNDILLEDLLETAKSAILARRYPFGGGDGELPAQYDDLQIRIAIDLYSKIGAEGERQHVENGVSRTYESAWIPESLLTEVTPMVGVLR